MFGVQADIFKDRFDEEEMKRHVTIRKELENEALPFLEYSAPRINTNMFNIKMDRKEISDSQAIPWMDRFASYSYIDIVMGLLSALSLIIGTIYAFWKNNPFAAKVEK